MDRFLFLLYSTTYVGSILNLLLGAFLGFIGAYLVFWIQQRSLYKGYLKILKIELHHLKEDVPGGLDDILTKYYKIKNDYDKGIKSTIYPELDNPESFFLKWPFWHKYAYLRNNLDKLYFFHHETVSSLLKIYSSMEEFEFLIRNKDNRLILWNNLEKVQSEIPHALSMLDNEKDTLDKILEWHEKLMRKQ